MCRKNGIFVDIKLGVVYKSLLKGSFSMGMFFVKISLYQKNGLMRENDEVSDVV